MTSMNNNEELFNQAKNEIEKLWSDNKNLSDFVDWPNDLILKEKNTHKINVADKLSTWKSPNDNQVDKIHNLISDLSHMFIGKMDTVKMRLIENSLINTVFLS